MSKYDHEGSYWRCQATSCRVWQAIFFIEVGILIAILIGGKVCR